MHWVSYHIESLQSKIGTYVFLLQAVNLYQFNLLEIDFCKLLELRIRNLWLVCVTYVPVTSDHVECCKEATEKATDRDT